MLRRLPGVFVAGEMLDWEVPTGGYLLQACFATGTCVGSGALQWLARSFPCRDGRRSYSAAALISAAGAIGA